MIRLIITVLSEHDCFRWVKPEFWPTLYSQSDPLTTYNNLFQPQYTTSTGSQTPQCGLFPQGSVNTPKSPDYSGRRFNLPSQCKHKPAGGIWQRSCYVMMMVMRTLRLLVIWGLEVVFMCVCVFCLAVHMTSTHVESSLQPRVDKVFPERRRCDPEPPTWNQNKETGTAGTFPAR